MAMTPEARVKKAIKDWLAAHGFWRAGAKRPEGEVVGWYFMPVSNGMGVMGIPDFVLVHRGKSVYIEAKKPGGVPTPNQVNRMNEIRAAGGEAYVVDNAGLLPAIFGMENVSE